MIHKSLNEIIEDQIDNFAASQTSVAKADVKPGTVIRGMMEAFALEVADAYSVCDDIEANRSVTTATGYNLDIIGMRIGCMRISGQSDDEYRSDIYSYLANKRTCSMDAIERAVRETAGIESFYIKNFAFGAGTFAVYVRPKSGASTSTLYSNLYEAVSSAAAAGVYFEIIFPTKISVSMEISIISSDNTNDIASRVKNSITKYVASIPSGQPLLLPTISQTVVAEIPSVSSIYIHKITFNNRTCYAQQYALLDNEQLVVDKITVIK